MGSRPIVDTKELGFLAENIAARHLESRGYRVIERNFRKPWGEIDVIAAKDGTFYFVEVKANRREFIGDFSPEVRVSPEKLSKIVKTAALYMTREAAAPEAQWQVDIISITFNQLAKKAKIKHFKNVAEDYN